MSNTYFISDTHFGHKNIIKYCNRPFDDVEEMNSTLIQRWNRTVRHDDVVWFLGDFILGTKEECKSILGRLNGIKKMIKGNHDKWTDEFYRSAGFDFVSHYPIVLKEKFILSHAPIANLTGDMINIYGHVHAAADSVSPNENSICVCVEKIGYKPIQIEVFNNACCTKDKKTNN